MNAVYAAIGQFVVWSFAVALAMVFPFDERVRAEVGGKIEPLPSSPISLALSLLGLVFVGLLAGRHWLPAVLTIVGLCSLLIPRKPRFRFS